jgi:hypothetical protein
VPRQSTRLLPLFTGLDPTRSSGPEASTVAPTAAASSAALVLPRGTRSSRAKGVAIPSTHDVKPGVPFQAGPHGSVVLAERSAADPHVPDIKLSKLAALPLSEVGTGPVPRMVGDRLRLVFSSGGFWGVGIPPRAPPPAHPSALTCPPPSQQAQVEELGIMFQCRSCVSRGCVLLCTPQCPSCG